MGEAISGEYLSHIVRARRASTNYLDSIKRAYLPPNEGAPAAFILLTCYIDFLSSLFAGKDASGTTFSDFVARFMASPGQQLPYDPKELYRSLRSKLVHNYAIWNSRYYLVRGHRELHLAKARPSAQLLNLEDFFDDVAKASEQYFSEVDRDRELQRRLAIRLDRVGTLDDVELVFDGEEFAAA
jgi:hypothetical protein